MARKDFSATQVKVADEGSVSAVIATLDVKDKDGDVTRKGFFGTQTTSIVLAHDWGPVMLGKGVITDQGDTGQAVFDGRFNMDDPMAAAVHSRLKFDMDNPPPIIEWSYGYRVNPGGEEKGDWNGEPVNFLKPLDDGSPGGKVFEVSPVMVGAGEGTGTLAVKSLSLADRSATVLAGLGELLDDVGALHEKLASEGHDLTPTKRAVLAELESALAEARKTVSGVLTFKPPHPGQTTVDQVIAEYARFTSLTLGGTR